MQTQVSQPDSVHARHLAVAIGVRSAKLEGFTVSCHMQVVNARFIRGEISAEARLAQARSLCEDIARGKRTGIA